VQEDLRVPSCEKRAQARWRAHLVCRGTSLAGMVLRAHHLELAIV
jgi:hypothetical protein